MYGSTAVSIWIQTFSSRTRLTFSGGKRGDIIVTCDILRERDFSLLRFSNSSNISGMVFSSSPSSREMTRVLNISKVSSEESFSSDIDRELFEHTEGQDIIDVEQGPGNMTGRLVYRLTENITNMDQSQIESSRDDLPILLSHIWNHAENTNVTKSSVNE